MELSRRRTTRLATTSSSRLMPLPSPSRPLPELLQTPTRALPSTEYRLCRSRVSSVSGVLPLPLPIPHRIKATIFDVGSRCGLRRSLLVLVTFVLVSAYTLDAQDFTFRVAEYMNAQVEVNHFRGSILIAKNGRVLVGERYGPANGLSDEQNTRDSRYRLGSIAKQFIAAAILQLQERGRLQL